MCTCERLMKQALVVHQPHPRRLHRVRCVSRPSVSTHTPAFFRKSRAVSQTHDAGGGCGTWPHRMRHHAVRQGSLSPLALYPLHLGPYLGPRLGFTLSCAPSVQLPVSAHDSRVRFAPVACHRPEPTRPCGVPGSRQRHGHRTNPNVGERTLCILRDV